MLLKHLYLNIISEVLQRSHLDWELSEKQQ